MHSIFFVLNAFLIVFECIIELYLASVFFSKKSTRAVYWLTFVVLILLANIVIYIFESAWLLKTISTIVLYTSWILLNFNSTVIKSAFITALNVSYLTILDTIGLLVVSSLGSAESNLILENPYAYYLLCYCCKIVEFFGIVLMRMWARNHFTQNVGSWMDWFRMLLFPAITLLVSLTLTRMLYAEPQLAPQLLLYTVLLLILDLMSVFILSYIEQKQTASHENAILRQNLKLESEHIASLKESYAEQRKQTHDFDNRLAVLRMMADEGAPQEEFARYLGQVLDTEFPSALHIKTHRTVVDVIVNQRMTTAKNKSIDFKYELEDLSGFPLSDDALVVVLTNLIDNAIEACEEIPLPQERKIFLKMRTQGNVSFLYIENTTNRLVKIHDNQVRTTKKDARAHGYGLKNVCAMLDDNEAEYVINYNEGKRIFQFSARISM